jgi:Tfp pilus assembly protein FimT
MAHDRYIPGRRTTGARYANAAWFSFLELMTTMAVGIILAAVAIPVVKSSVQYFRVRSAVSSNRTTY